MMAEPVFLHVELRIVPAEFRTFLDTMQEVTPLIIASGWKLVGAWQVRVGRAFTLRVIWELPDADTYFQERLPFTRHPRFAEYRTILSRAVEEEVVSMMTRVPYGEDGSGISA
ncbi:NIPSNAP family protein [Niveispirillum fermenti]|uniref:NIPSNAP family protein n=1 Tax=Niveispirillum fermenti TaxID=1233113 RepID=UPI003A8A3DD6